jgi:hypothetical protein
VSRSGGKFLMIVGIGRAAPISVNVTGEVFDVAGTLKAIPVFVEMGPVLLHSRRS